MPLRGGPKPLSQEATSLIVNIVALLAKYNNLNKKHVNAVYLALAKDFYSESVNLQRILLATQILKSLLEQ